MDEIYLLTNRLGNNSEGSFIGLKGQKLINLTVEKSVEHDQVHSFLNESFEYCAVKPGDTPSIALFNYGKIYSEKKNLRTLFKLTKLKNSTGMYYPRIFRPFIEEKETLSHGPYAQLEKLRKEVLQYPDYFPYDTKLLLMALNQLAILKEILLSILNTIHPSIKNLKTFGQNTKNLLVLSCIEVETQLKGIYKANEKISKLNYNTSDYVKIKPIMQLDRHEVKLPFYPDLKAVVPFKNWKKENPTKSLIWYDSYNAIKHNSELEFNRATLENSISAICAVAILIKAQYGSHIPFWQDQIGAFFEIRNNSKWATEEKILPPLKNKTWTINKMGL